MVLYKICHSLNLKEVGIYNQIQAFDVLQFVKPYPVVQEGLELIKSIKFPIYQIERRAKLTDLMNNVPLGDEFLMLSSTACEIFKSFSMRANYFYPLEFKLGTKIINDYYAFYILKDRVAEDYFQWEKMSFSLINRKTRTKIESAIKIDGYNNYLNLLRASRNNDNTLVPDVIKIKKEIPFDIIRLNFSFVVGGYFCNEKVYDAINHSRLTGFAFERMPDNMFN